MEQMSRKLEKARQKWRAFLFQNKIFRFTEKTVAPINIEPDARRSPHPG
jgi:hypothetical protein